MASYCYWRFSSRGVGSARTPSRRSRHASRPVEVVPGTMPAVVLTHEREIELQERPRPTLRPDQVIVEVDLCGICGSDLPAPQMPQVYHANCILGHESTGHVVAVGSDVTGWNVGQQVAVNPNGNV